MRLDSPKMKRAAGWIGAFALPVAIVQIAGWMSGSAGPAQARATDHVQHDAMSPVEEALLKITVDEAVRKRFSPIELAAAAQIERLRTEAFGPTPMLHAPPPKTAPESQTIEVLDPPEGSRATDDPVPVFHLQAVMSGTDSSPARALINGRVCATGENVPDTDWTVVEVNADERRVTLKHAPTDRTIAISLKSPN